MARGDVEAFEAQGGIAFILDLIGIKISLSREDKCERSESNSKDFSGWEVSLESWEKIDDVKSACKKIRKAISR